MQYTLRREEKGDWRAVETLTREAFWNLHMPGCDEHLLAHNLRVHPAFVPELDYVALAGDELVGNIMYSKAKVVGADGTAREVLTFGPLSVLPAWQKKGVGAALVRHTLPLAAALGYPGVVIFGHPEYYPRFGFVNAGTYGIATEEGKNLPPFMALELEAGALAPVKGRFIVDEAFKMDAADVDAFDATFPPKEKKQPEHPF